MYLFLSRRAVVEFCYQVHLPNLCLERVPPLYHDYKLSIFFKSDNFEENLPKQNLLSWCKDSSKRVVSWGNKNKGVVSSSFSLATIASIPQEIIHRSSSCTRAFATKTGKRYFKRGQSSTFRDRRFWKVRSPLGSLFRTLVKLFRWDTYNSLYWMVVV